MKRSLIRSFASSARLALAVWAAVWTVGCTTEPFRVASKVEGAPPETLSPPVAVLAETTVRARALRDEHESLERFDANHLLAGVMPIEIRLENNAQTSVNVKSFRCRLLDEAGRELKRLETKDAINRLIKYYDVRAYSVDGFGKFQEKYERQTLPRSGAVAPGDFVQGLAFFRLPSGSRNFTQPLTLVVESRSGKGGGAVRIELK
jgi:hypothetical protein